MRSIVRFATEGDLPSMVSLLEQLFAQEAEFVPNARANRAGLRAILRAPSTGLLFVVEVDGAVVGMVSLLFLVSTALGARVGLLEDFVVDERHRGLGLGTRLLRHVLCRARRMGLRRVTLLTDGDNVAAQRLYAAHGFVGSDMVVRRLSLAAHAAGAAAKGLA